MKQPHREGAEPSASSTCPLLYDAVCWNHTCRRNPMVHLCVSAILTASIPACKCSQ